MKILRYAVPGLNPFYPCSTSINGALHLCMFKVGYHFKVIWYEFLNDSIL